MVDWLLNKRWRTIMTGILIATIPVLSLAVFVYLTLVYHLLAQSNEKRTVIAYSAAKRLESRLNSTVVFGTAYAERPLLVEALAAGDIPALARHLQSLVRTSDTIERVFVASPRGVLLADYPSDPNVIGQDFSARDWYRGVTREWSPYVSEFYQRQAKPQRALFAIAIPVRADGKVVGILVMQPKADFVRLALDEFKEIVSGTLYVVDRQGRLIYHSRRPDDNTMADFAPVPVVARVRAGLSGTEQFLDPETGEEVNAAYHPVGQVGWGLVTERSLTEVLAPVTGLVRWLALFAGGMVLLAVLLAYRWADMFSTSRAVALRLQKEEAFDKAYTAILILLNRQFADLAELGEAVLSKVAELTGAEAALFYGEEEGRLTPCRALTVPLPAEPDELARESLRRRQTVRLREIPDESLLRLSTGTGTFLPREVIATPLLFKEEPMGVLELASLHGFSEGDLRLVDRLGPQLSIAINTINNSQARRQLSDKLASSNEELQGMNAELQAMNEELQAMNEELQAQQQELGQSNRRLEEMSRAKSDFLANMSHELRTPLSSIIGFSEVLQDQMFGTVNEKQAEYVGHILTSGQHLLSLINDILDLAKVESGNMELELNRFPLKGLLTASLTIVKEKAMKHGISLELDLAPEADREILADSRKLKQILYNLLSNAVKFTPQGGTVTVAARLVPEGGDCLEIGVTDTGIGIREEDMARLFQPFSQLESAFDKRYEGTGLGLALTKRLVTLHGGAIQVESRVGEGSRFVFTIPRNGVKEVTPGPSTEEVAAREAQPSDPVLAPGANILLIEDEPLARAAIGNALAAQGYRIRTAGGGLEGIATAFCERPDLIILDLLMSDLSGFEVAKRLRAAEATKDVPIMVLTAMCLSAAERQQLETQVWRIAEKGSLSSREFADLVARAVGRRP